MAPIVQTEALRVALDSAQIRERVLAWFAVVPHKVVVDTPTRLEVKSGSQLKMRLIGGAFIAGSSLPTHTTVLMESAGTVKDVTVTAADAVGFGVKTGMKGKYERRVAEIAAGIREALS